ncbi:fructosyl amino acid oxidase [Plenodomus tracheiphilus IPT5]|uniref:Fructosyl amino acid oxidase n=1 Tax=Plenodomus tracheiphilus IPT5 TaxID=1408161 RepID=A0A6A7B9T2_9PLEO|nr:fructosyl amino acid oxidase [Plenodomus tracheiphilus IPT5]
MASSRSNTTVIIVGGGGTIGSSTALHLVRSGYTPSNITVLDTYPIPSAQSAGNDLNKIMGIRLRNKVDLQLSLEARQMWKEDELFKPFFHNTGRLDCAHGEEDIKALKETYKTLLTADSSLAETNIWLDTEDEILAKHPQLSRAQITGWKAIFSSDGGWLAAADAINAIGQYLHNQGVNFFFGPAGTFKQPLLRNGLCTGVETTNGTIYHADKVVLAAGAWSPALIDLKDQCISKAWVYAHLPLSPSEARPYKSTPVIYNPSIGFFFEPTSSTTSPHVIKICDEFPGFTHFESHRPFGAAHATQISVPRSHADNPSDTYPDVSETSIRKAVSTFLPRFEGRALQNRRLCWCTDTADAGLLVCEYPGWEGFFVATGDSGHSFKLLPNIGKHVVELLEGRLAEDLAYAWRWRPGTGDALKSRRAARAKDLTDLPGWRLDDVGRVKL